MTGIYCIKNMINGKMYIGKSIDINSRLAGHFRGLGNNSHHSIKLQHAWNKYSPENFVTGTIEECDVEDLDSRERFYIELYDSYRNGYNCVIPTGENSGYFHTEETKEKHSISMKAAHLRMNPLVRLKVLDALRNSPHAGGTVEYGVLLYDMDTFSLSHSFTTVEECSNFLKCSKCAVNKNIAKLRKNESLSFKGFILIRDKSSHTIETYLDSRVKYQSGVMCRKAMRSGLAIANKFKREYAEIVRVRNNTENRNASWRLNSLKSKDALRRSGKCAVDIYLFDTGEHVGRWGLLSDFATEYGLRLESLQKAMGGERRYHKNFVVKKVI